MKIIEFQDINQQKITVQYSSAGYIRVYCKPPKAPDEAAVCLHMTHNQARILICAIEDLLDGAE